MLDRAQVLVFPWNADTWFVRIACFDEAIKNNLGWTRFGSSILVKWNFCNIELQTILVKELEKNFWYKYFQSPCFLQPKIFFIYIYQFSDVIFIC